MKEYLRALFRDSVPLFVPIIAHSTCHLWSGCI